MSTPRARVHAGREVEVDPCLVSGCGAESVRHLSMTEARRGFPGLPEKGRRAPLCRAHYKEWKKSTKDKRTLDRLGW